MKKFKFSFKGRQRNAIGIFYKITDTYTAENINQACFMLYTDYEHISFLKCNGEKVTDVQFEECEVPKRQYKPNQGTYVTNK